MPDRPPDGMYYTDEEGRDYRVTNIPEFQRIAMNIFDEEEIHHNCTVQILRNSVTGEYSVGWWENDTESEARE